MLGLSYQSRAQETYHNSHVSTTHRKSLKTDQRAIHKRHDHRTPRKKTRVTVFRIDKRPLNQNTQSALLINQTSYPSFYHCLLLHFKSTISPIPKNQAKKLLQIYQVHFAVFSQDDWLGLGNLLGDLYLKNIDASHLRSHCL